MAEKTKTIKQEKANIHITGMTCTNCAATIEKGLAETPGVEKANVSFASEKASVEYDPTRVDLGKLNETISQLGYGIATKKSIFPVGGMTCVRVRWWVPPTSGSMCTCSASLMEFPGACQGSCPAPELRCISTTCPSARWKVVNTFRKAWTV